MRHNVLAHLFLLPIERQISVAVSKNIGIELSFLTGNITTIMAGIQNSFPLLKRLKDQGKIISAHLPSRDILLGAFDEVIRIYSINKILEYAHLARNLNASWAVLHLNFMEAFYSPLEHIWAEYVSEALERIAKVLEIRLENTEERSPGIFKMILERGDDKKLKMCLDIGHAYGYSISTVENWIEELAPWITEIHLHETERFKDLHRPLGSGLIDLERILRQLEDKVGDFVITLEPVSIEQLENDLKWLEARGYL